MNTVWYVCAVAAWVCPVVLSAGAFEGNLEVLSLLQVRAHPTSATGRTVGVSNMYPPYTSDELLWEGFDDRDGLEDMVAIRPGSGMVGDRAIRMDSHANGHFSSPVPLQIMGHYNTGTNLLGALLEKNFPGKFAVQSSENSADPVCHFWKHVSLSWGQVHDPHFSASSCRSRGVVGIAMVRNPLSWLSSFKRVAYDLDSCRMGDWLTQPCTYPSGTPGNMGGAEFENVEAIWNAWTKDYGSLPSFGFDRSLVVRYEDLVLDTEGEMGKIAGLVDGVEAPSSVRVVTDDKSPTKSSANAQEVATQKIKSKSYLASFTDAELKQACARLDTKLMHLHGYKDCDGVN